MFGSSSQRLWVRSFLIYPIFEYLEVLILFVVQSLVLGPMIFICHTFGHKSVRLAIKISAKILIFRQRWSGTLPLFLVNSIEAAPFPLLLPSFLLFLSNRPLLAVPPFHPHQERKWEKKKGRDERSSSFSLPNNNPNRHRMLWEDRRLRPFRYESIIGFSKMGVILRIRITCMRMNYGDGRQRRMEMTFTSDRNPSLMTSNSLHLHYNRCRSVSVVQINIASLCL